MHHWFHEELATEMYEKIGKVEDPDVQTLALASISHGLIELIDQIRGLREDLGKIESRVIDAIRESS